MSVKNGCYRWYVETLEGDKIFFDGHTDTLKQARKEGDEIAAICPAVLRLTIFREFRNKDLKHWCGWKRLKVYDSHR